MIRAQILAISISSMLLATSAARGEDLSAYREFHFGMSLPQIAKLVGMNLTEVRAIHQRPALIQEMEWQPFRYPGSAPDADPVKDILFSFCDGELFRMVVNYDRYKTGGMTSDDMIEAITAKYGVPTRPAAEIIFPSIYNETVKVIARWEDSQYSFNLVRSSYQASFGMVLYSKQQDALARTAVAEALRLEAQEAPQKEADRQKKQEDENHAREEKARLVNKASFRP